MSQPADRDASGLAGLKNRRLLEAVEAAGLDVPFTVDRNIPYQQNLSLVVPDQRFHGVAGARAPVLITWEPAEIGRWRCGRFCRYAGGYAEKLP